MTKVPKDRAYSISCYLCDHEIMGKSMDDCYAKARTAGWGYTWGSDGVYPDGASAMYACAECRDHDMPSI